MAIFRPVAAAQAFRALAVVVGLATLVLFVPLWAPLVLAAWAATMARPLVVRLSRVTGGRERAAGVLVAALVLLITVPLALSAVSLVHGAVALTKRVLAASGARDALVALVSDGDGASTLDAFRHPQKLVALVQDYGGQAMDVAFGIAGAATDALLGVFVFLYGVYVFLVDGPAYYAWIEEHAPIGRAPTRRLAAAFKETGRGLIVGIGLTGLAQGLVATITYVALGVPRALLLGMLTCLASVIPSVGTALIWVPLAAGLAISGRSGSAAILAGVGVVVIGSIDNVLRPVFARAGRLELPAFVLLTSIFGGLAVFGTWGFILGPLLVRLTKEALVIAREDRLRDEPSSVMPPSPEGTD